MRGTNDDAVGWRPEVTADGPPPKGDCPGAGPEALLALPNGDCPGAGPEALVAGIPAGNR